MDYYLPKGPFTSDNLTIRSIKLYADGALGSRGAKLKAPYSDDPRKSGLILSDTEFYKDVMKKAYDAGFQVNMHAIGDEAVHFVLNLYGEFLQGKNDRRWRIEHAQIVDPADFELFGKYNIIPSIQSTHATSDMGWADERVGPERIKGAYAQKQLLEQNGWLVNGTDFPIENISPLLTYYAAVFRKDLQGLPENGFQMENALSREEALRSITIWAAKGSFEEDVKGSIEPQKLADFVVLDHDLSTATEKEVLKTKPIVVFSSGKKVFQAE
jgi:predicted amidohydrolase YtcJ